VHNQRSLRLRNSRHSINVPVGLDALESRILLSGTPGTNFDLVPSVTKTVKLASAVITDTAVKGSVVVIVTDNGTDASPAASLSAFLRPAGGTGSTDINITTKPAPVSSIKGSVTKKGITKDNNKSVTVNVSLPLTLAAGSYSLVIKVADNSPTGSAAQLNNAIVVPFTLSATAAFTSLSETLTTAKIPSTIAGGTAKSGTILLTLANAGNIATFPSLQYDIAIVLRPAAGADIPVISKADVTIPTIKPNGGTKTIGAPIAVSAAATAAIPAGTYTLVALLTPSAGSTGTAVTVVGPAITFTNSNSGPTAGAVLEHGDTMAFTSNTQLTETPLLEFGSFTTNLHVSGSYTYENNILTLMYSTGQQQALTIDPTGTPMFFDPTLDGNPTTVIFSFNSANAFASIDDQGATGTQTAFAKYG
jgi:hypothetical protein